MARIKWIKNDVSLERGNYLAVVVKFDNSKVWLRPAAMMTARNVKFWAESLAKEHNSSTVELKYFKDCTDEKIITYYLYYDETEGELVEGYRTEIEVEDGEEYILDEVKLTGGVVEEVRIVPVGNKFTLEGD